MPTSRPHIQLFTDGACLGNPGPGGWAYICRNPQTNDECHDSGGEPDTTNNRMELTAVIRALESLGGKGQRDGGGEERDEGKEAEPIPTSSLRPSVPSSLSPCPPSLRPSVPSLHIELIGDSEYVLKGLTEWLPGWKKRNWRRADKKPVLNADLWKKLDELQARHHITITWVRGHTGHTENERCDLLAKEEAMRRA
ncbi:MAG: ribonuclease H family protein [Phycisphaerales bacterium]